MLDLSELTAEIEPQMVDADVVRRVAMAAKRKHGWCAEVEKALKDAGIDPEPKKRQVRVHFTGTVALDVDPAEYKGLDEDAIKEKVRAKATFAIGKNGSISEISEIEVIKKEVHEAIPVSSASDLAERAAARFPGYTARYASQDGRVYHLFLTSVLQGAASYFIDAVCSDDFALRDLTETSPRGENRVCRKCQDRAERRTL